MKTRVPILYRPAHIVGSLPTRYLFRPPATRYLVSFLETASDRTTPRKYLGEEDDEGQRTLAPRQMSEMDAEDHQDEAVPARENSLPKKSVAQRDGRQRSAAKMPSIWARWKRTKMTPSQCNPPNKKGAKQQTPSKATMTTVVISRSARRTVALLRRRPPLGILTSRWNSMRPGARILPLGVKASRGYVPSLSHRLEDGWDGKTNECVLKWCGQRDEVVYSAFACTARRFSPAMNAEGFFPKMAAGQLFVQG